MRWALQIFQLTTLRWFYLQQRVGETRHTMTDSLSWEGEPESPEGSRDLKLVQLSTGEDKAEQRILNVSIGSPWEYSRVLIKSCILVNYTKLWEKHPRILEIIVLRTHTRKVIRCFPIRQIRKLSNSWSMDRIPEVASFSSTEELG